MKTCREGTCFRVSAHACSSDDECMQHYLLLLLFLVIGVVISLMELVRIIVIIKSLAITVCVNCTEK